MDNRTLSEQKRWYLAAVRSNLILNYGMQEEQADAAIEAYQLRERLEIAPDAQLHYDIDDTTDEMIETGFFIPSY